MKLFAFLSQFYYSLGGMVLAELVALGVAIKYYRRHKILRIFPYYLLLSLMEVWTDYLSGIGDRPVSLINLHGGVSNVFMLFEYSVCTLFILRYISSRGRRRAIYINSLLFAGLLAFALIQNWRNAYQANFFFWESFFLLLPCLLYFYDLFVSAQPGSLTDQPSFWVVTGFLFLNACTIPMLLAVLMLGRYHVIALSLNYILYIVLCILLIRAYRCPPVKPCVNAPADQ